MLLSLVKELIVITILILADSFEGLEPFYGVSHIAYILICILLPIMLYSTILFVKIKDVMLPI